MSEPLPPVRRKPRGPNHATSQATKQRILAAAESQVKPESWLIDPFSTISISLVAKRAEISRAGLSKHFGTREELGAALTERLLNSAAFWDDSYAESERFIESLRESDPLDALAAFLQYELCSTAGYERWPLVQALQIRAAHDPHLADLTRAGYEVDDKREWRLLEPLLHRLGRVPRRPLSGDDVAAAFIALVEGAAMRRLVGESRLDSERGDLASHFTLFSVAAVELLLSLTERELDEECDDDWWATRNSTSTTS